MIAAGFHSLRRHPVPRCMKTRQRATWLYSPFLPTSFPTLHPCIGPSTIQRNANADAELRRSRDGDGDLAVARSLIWLDCNVHRKALRSVTTTGDFGMPIRTLRSRRASVEQAVDAGGRWW